MSLTANGAAMTRILPIKESTLISAQAALETLTHFMVLDGPEHAKALDAIEDLNQFFDALKAAGGLANAKVVAA